LLTVGGSRAGKQGTGEEKNLSNEMERNLKDKDQLGSA